MKRKIISVLLCTVMLFTMFSASFAVSVPEISVTSAKAVPGEKVQLSVNVNGNPGINTFTMGFDYDKSRLELEDVKISSSLGGQFTYAKRAVWLNSCDTKYNGEVLILYFKVLDDAPLGDAKVAVTYRKGDIANYNEEDVDFKLSSGNITVEKQKKELGIMSVSNASAVIGDKVNLKVNIDKNPGINTFILSFLYDKSMLRLDSVTPSSGLGGQFNYAKKAVWLNSSDTEYTGEILTLGFTVLDSAKDGDSKVEVSYVPGEISNYNEEDVDFELKAGTVTISTVKEHVYDEGVIIKSPTCTTEGERKFTCIKCGHTYIEKIPMVPHSYNAEFVPPTKTEKGYTLYTCRMCGKSYKEDYIDPITEKDPCIVVSNVRTAANKEIKVDISLENNPGITAIRLFVGYDSDVLSLIDVKNSDLLSEMSYVTSPSLDTCPYQLQWSSGVKNISESGVLVTLTFKVKKEAASGKYPVTIKYNADDIFNTDFENELFGVENGNVEIIDYIPGDVNNDGIVNLKDVASLQQYLSGWQISVNTDAGDTNGDGSINLKDVALLQQYLSGWQVKLN